MMNTYIDEPGNVARSDSVIPYHRHCQATVCSIYGPTGMGQTKGLIESLSLTGLSQIEDGWLDLFRQNRANITEDLSSILTLIDKIAYKVLNFSTTGGGSGPASGTIQLDDLYGEPIGVYDFNQYGVTQIKAGYRVNISINNKPLSFHTLKRESEKDTLSLELTPDDIYGDGISDRQIRLSINGETLQFHPIKIDPTDITEITLDEFNFEVDKNKIPLKGAFVDDWEIEPSAHILRIDIDSDTEFSLDMCEEYGEYVAESTGAISFEVHVKNTSGSSIQFTNPVSPVTYDQQENISTVQPGNINAYRYRVYPTETDVVMTRSLKEIYLDSGDVISYLLDTRVEPEGAGVISSDKPYTKTVKGNVVTFSANRNIGWAFDSWSDDGTGLFGNDLDLTSNPLGIVKPDYRKHTLVARFTETDENNIVITYDKNDENLPPIEESDDIEITYDKNDEYIQ